MDFDEHSTTTKSTTNNRRRCVLLIALISVAACYVSFRTLRTTRNLQLEGTILFKSTANTALRKGTGSSLSTTPLQLQLKVPFYIYENGLDWSNATQRWNGTDTKLANSDYPQYKHSDDYWLLQQAKKHPMRTLDPSQAKLFFVPTLLSALEVAFVSYIELCVDGRCNDNLLDHADQLLRGSPWFQRNQGRDHIIVDAQWHWYQWHTYSSKNYSLFHDCNMISWENTLPKGWDLGGRLNIPSMYVGKPCEPAEKKQKDFAMVASLHPEREWFHSRRDICSWLHNSTSTSYQVSLCGEGDQCPALADAKYGFHVRGDTWGSNRLIDTLLSRTVPLFTDEEQLKILPDFVPWNEMSYMVDVSSEENFHESLQHILSQPESEYQAKQAAISQYMNLFDHTKVHQFDGYMHRFAQLLDLYTMEDW